MVVQFFRQGMLSLGVLCCMLLAGSAIANPEQSFTLRFAPPTADEVQFKYKNVVQNQGKKQTLVITGVSERIMSRMSDDNRHFRSTLKELRITRGGLDVPDDVIESLVGLNAIVITDNRLRVTEVGGDEELRKRMKGHQIDDVLAALGYSTNHDEMLRMTRRTWRERMTRFVGRTVKFGDIWIDTTEFLLLGQEKVPVYRATIFTRPVTLTGEPENSLRIKVICNASADGLANELKTANIGVGFTPQQIIEAVDDPIPDNPVYQLAAESITVLDRATMMVISETSRVEATRNKIQPDNKTRGQESINETMEARYVNQH